MGRFGYGYGHERRCPEGLCRQRLALWRIAAKKTAGSEIVQVVIALGFAVGLGAALMILQTQVNTAITSAGNSVTNMFKSVTSGAVGSR